MDYDSDCSYCSGDDDDGMMPEEGVMDEEKNNEPTLNYKVLSPDDIRLRQEEGIAEVCNVLSVSRVHATLLLVNYNWCIGKVQDEWFTDEEKVRTAVGLLEREAARLTKAARLVCSICFEGVSYGEMNGVACGHLFCRDCWKGYISTWIKDGPACLRLRCPEPSCRAAVGRDMVDASVSDKDKDQYAHQLVRSYVEGKSNIKWCPAPDCIYAIEFETGGCNFNVTCNCTYSFCWNCSNELHRPVDCEIVRKWNLKNQDESENVNWILVNTKACPKCNKPIEKNQGCMHMTCRPPCHYQFCWLCLSKWGSHQCNKFEMEEENKQKSMAKKMLDRYAHHFERWAANQKSREKAVAELRQLESRVKELSMKQCQTEASLSFVKEAWEQIIECRRVLKWTYAYGYYMPPEDHKKREFFQWLQGEAETALERLHKCTEIDLQVYMMDLQVYMKDGAPITEIENAPLAFDAYRSKLMNLTKVTRTYFENLVQALENGLADVNSLDHGGQHS